MTPREILQQSLIIHGNDFDKVAQALYQATNVIGSTSITSKKWNDIAKNWPQIVAGQRHPNLGRFMNDLPICSLVHKYKESPVRAYFWQDQQNQHDFFFFYESFTSPLVKDEGDYHLTLISNDPGYHKLFKTHLDVI